MKKMKKFFASLLVLCMVLTLPNMAVFAADEITLGETITTDTAQVSGEYQYTVAEDGVYKVELISVESTEATKRITCVEADDYAFVDEPLEVVAYKDDVLNFVCEAYTTDYTTWLKTYGTGTFVWKVTYEGQVPGTATNPEDIGSIYNEGGQVMLETSVLTFGTEATYYYYTYTAEADGEVSVWIDYTWNYVSDISMMDLVVKDGAGKVVENEMGAYSQTNPWTGMTVSVEYPKATLDVKEGDVITIQVGLQAYEMAAGMEYGTVYAVASFAAAEGSSMNPIALEVTEDVDYTAEKPGTVTVPAGASVYYTADSAFSGMLLVVEGSNLEISTQSMMTGAMEAHPAVNGVAEAPIYMNRLTWACTFVITNKGSEAADYTVYFDTVEGTEYAPVEITDEAEVTLEAGDGAYYYVYTATEDGYIKVSVDSTSEWFFYVETEELRTENHYSNNEELVAVSDEYIAVTAGDEVIIVVMTFDATTGNTVAGTLTTTVEYVTPDVATVEGTIGDIVTASKGDVVLVELLDKDGNATTVIPAEIIGAAKDAEVVLGVVGDFYVWAIDGSKVTSAKALDLAVTITTDVVPEALIKEVAGELNAIVINIAHDGELGLEAELGIYYGEECFEAYVNLFYYNEDGELEFLEAVTVDEDGYAVFTLNHASDYVLVDGDDLTPDTPDNGTEEDTVPDNGDVSMTLVYVIVLMGAALVVAGFVSKKKFA